MDKTIEIKIDRLGTPVIEAKGFTNGDCVAATVPLEKALTDGAGVNREYKPEFRNTKGTEVQQELRRM